MRMKIWAVIKNDDDGVREARFFTSPEVAIPYARATGAEWHGAEIEVDHGVEFYNEFTFRWSYKRKKTEDGWTGGWKRLRVLDANHPPPENGVLELQHNVYSETTGHGSLITVRSSVSMEHAVATAREYLLTHTGVSYEFDGFPSPVNDGIAWVQSEIATEKEAKANAS